MKRHPTSGAAPDGEVTADSGEYQVLAKWDTPKVVKGVSFLLRLTVATDDGSERLTSAPQTTETTASTGATGGIHLTVRAVKCYGQQGDPATTIVPDCRKTRRGLS